jgi:glyoxylase-like metal-dependent hydrolase (beta-lactamase superfamily II)
MQMSREVAPGLSWMRTLMVNVAFLEPEPRNGSWVLVDAGLPGYKATILRAARARFGNRAPSAIVLTHAHFDHVGNLQALAEYWDVPIYAHSLELPHLTGRRSYPPPDPTVGGGVLAWSSRLFPRAPVDVSTRVRALPDDGSIPPLPGWRWWHTPGPTDGHVSLFRDTDRALVSGDAVITVQQESLTAVLAQSPTLHGPPAYFTTNWSAALGSVRDIADLTPNVLVPGHGVALSGPALTRGLRRLADTFHERVPAHGRYVTAAARAREDGGYDLPPDPYPAAWKRVAGGVALASAAAAWAWTANRRARVVRRSPGEGGRRRAATVAEPR